MGALGGWSLLGLRDIPLLVVYFLCQLQYAIIQGLIGPTAPIIAKRLHVDKYALLAEASMYAIPAGSIACLITGRFLDSLESAFPSFRSRAGHCFIGVCLLLYGVVLMLIYHADSKESFILATGYIQVLVGVLNVVSTTLALRVGLAAEARAPASADPLVESSPRSGVEAHSGVAGACMSMVHVGVGAAAALGPVICSLAAGQGWGEMAGYPLSALLSVLVAAPFFVLRAAPTTQAVGDSSAGAACPESPSAASIRPDGPSFAMTSSMLALAALAITFTDGPLFALMQVLESLDKDLGASPSDSNALAATMGVAITAGRILTSIMGMYLSPSKVLLATLPVSCLAAVQLAAMGSFGSGGTGRLVGLALTSIIGFGVAPSFTWIIAVFARVVPTTATHNGLFVLSAGVGLMVMLKGISFVEHPMGPAGVLRFNALAVILGTVATFLLDGLVRLQVRARASREPELDASPCSPASPA